MHFLKALFGKKQKQKKTKKARDSKRYTKEKDIISKGDVNQKRKIAASTKSHPEILFYLASDEDVQTRREVAKNMGTPVQVSEILVKDEDDDVRLLLADRLVKLLPGLAEDMQSQLYAFAVKALGTLARDEVAKVRVALSTALQDHAYAPPSVAKQLAMDVERAVAEPILVHCAKLSDEDLMAIISEHPEDWALDAVIQRKTLNSDITGKLFSLVDEDKGRKLLKNENIALEKQTLQNIVEKSEDYLTWQEPVALRSELSFSLAQQLVGFCQDTIFNVLTRRKDFDTEMAQEISDLVKRRMDFMAVDNPGETLEQKVNRFATAGKLDSVTILDALAWKEEGFVKLSMSRLSGVHHLIVEKVFASQSPKSITALSWYCGFPMRVAVELQKTLGRVPHQSLLYAKSGLEYPLDETDMIWQLEFFGIEIEIDPEKIATEHSKS